MPGEARVLNILLFNTHKRTACMNAHVERDRRMKYNNCFSKSAGAEQNIFRRRYQLRRQLFVECSNIQGAAA